MSFAYVGKFLCIGKFMVKVDMMLAYRRCSAWNGLAKNIAEANTLDIFKSKLQN